jgi:predicted metalloprotease with PDZ domain
LAGSIQEAKGERGDRLIVLGTPAFDLAPALELCTAALAGARRLFDPTDGQPFSFVFVPRRGLGTHYDGAALHNGFAIWFDALRPLDTRLRLLAAHEITHRWIGGALRFTNDDAVDATWFSEGFTVHYARTLLLREGLLSPQEFLDDVGRDLAAQARSFTVRGRQAKRKNEEVVHHHAAPAYYRGALYAARLDGLLRAADRGNLEDLLGGLFAEAQSEGAQLPESAWRRALSAALGPTADVDFHRLVVLADEPIDLPKGSLGPCFERVPVQRSIYELGFSAASLTTDPPTISGLAPGSAAERAGLRNGQRIVAGAETIREGNLRRRVRLIVTGEEGTRSVRYRPVRQQEDGAWRVRIHPACRAAGPPSGPANLVAPAPAAAR